MKKPTIAAAVAAVAIAMTMPFALGQTTANSDTAPPAASSRGNGVVPNTMYGQSQSQGQRTYGPDMTRGDAQGQGSGGYGPGMMGGNAQSQSQGGYGSGMMDGYGFGWMGGYGGIWVPILLVLLVAGVVIWVVTQKRK